MKSSYSKSNTYINCPQMYKNQYVDRYEPMTQGASLMFGTAIDAAATAMLQEDPKWLIKFYDRFEYVVNNGVGFKSFDSDKISYSHKDFDADILEPKDVLELEKWAKELNMIPLTNIVAKSDVVRLFKEAAKAKSSPYIKMTDEQLKYFNRCSWLSLKRKGRILLESFEKQFKPKVKKVHALQKHTKIVDQSTGDEIVGVIDLVVDLEGYDKPVILDLKTSAFPYEASQLELSPQLTLYSAMEAHNFQTDLVGYVVLCKNIPKDEVSICSSCGNKKNTRHKTCDLITNGQRCNGVWTTTIVPNPQVQVIVEKKSQEQIDSLLLDYGNILLAMKNNIVYKNTNLCTNFYGGLCPFYKLCHKGDASGLIKKS